MHDSAPGDWPSLCVLLDLVLHVPQHLRMLAWEALKQLHKLQRQLLRAVKQQACEVLLHQFIYALVACSTHWQATAKHVNNLRPALLSPTIAFTA